MKTDHILIRVSSEFKEEVREISSKKGLSMSAYIIMVLIEKLWEEKNTHSKG